MATNPLAPSGVAPLFYTNQSIQGQIKYKEYILSRAFQELDSTCKEAIVRTTRAIGCVLTDDGQQNGSALYIGQGFIIVPKHCFPAEKGLIRFISHDSPIIATTVVNGELDPSLGFKADYKILFTEHAYDIEPAKLSIEVAKGPSVQINYQVDGELYMTPYESVEEAPRGYATRSDFSSVITIDGDSGGSRFSINARAIHSIHQGESEALKMNDIYHSLEQIKNRGQLPQQILEILRMNIIDDTMLRMHFSSVSLQSTHVIPERHGRLAVAVISRERINPLTAQKFQDIFNFLDSINSQNSKRDFYARIWARIGTQYELPTFRLDTQSPRYNAANLQIQVDRQTVATVLVSAELQNYVGSITPRIAEVTNYVVRQFRNAVNYARLNQTALVMGITLIGRISTLRS
jgi:hypothetical protein